MANTMVAQKFFDMSQDEATHDLLVQDPAIMDTVVSLMSSANSDIASLATGAVKNLAKNESILPVLHNQQKMLTTLTTLTGSANTTIKRNALSALKRLNRYGLSANNENAGSTSENQRHTSPSQSKQKKIRGEKKQKKLRTIVFDIGGNGMESESTCQQIEKYLVRVKGLTSLTLDQRKNQVLITTRKKTKKIAPSIVEALQKAGVKASRVREIREKSKARIEEEEEEDEANETGAAGEVGYMNDEEYFGGERKGVLSRFGSNSLQQRLAEQRRKQQEAEQQKSSTDAIAAGVGNAVRSVSSWFGY